MDPAKSQRRTAPSCLVEADEIRMRRIQQLLAQVFVRRALKDQFPCDLIDVPQGHDGKWYAAADVSVQRDCGRL